MAQPAQTIFTNIGHIRALSASEAAHNFPVHIRGTVVAEPGGGDRFVMLDSGVGIYVQGPAGLLRDLHRGDLIEVEGVVDPGEFAPFVSLQSVRRIGQGTIPPPQPVTFEQLITGRFDSQWVEISGIVRRCDVEIPDHKYMLDVATGGGRLAVQIIGTLDPGELIDAEVRFPGVSFYQVNKSRQVISPLLVVPGGANFTITKPAPENAFSTPILSSANLLQFAPEGAYGHRVHLRGSVIHHLPGETLWIRDASGGLRVRSMMTEALNPGDEVDVLGFPARGEYTPMLEDAVYRKRGAGELPEPIVLTEALAALGHDANLIELTAQFTGKQLTSDGWALLMQQGSLMFRALLRGPQDILPSEWQVGSKVRLRGIASVTFDAPKTLTGVAQPRTFDLLLRSPSDLTILQLPPWWTRERTVWVLAGVTSVLILGIGAVIWAAKKRLREQAVERALAEAEFTAILSERNRVAREIHDTLAQGLSAISMQLELAKSQMPPDAASATGSIEQAHNLVRESLAEARNSIWNMRSQVLENKSLVLALSGILQQLTSGTGIDAKFECVGHERRLPPVTENNLLRIGQEAITNAVKHAKARHIKMTLGYQSREIELRVTDDGTGFDVERPPASDSGFGLRGMRERAAELRGTLLIQSGPNGGTELILKVPVAS